MGKITNWIVQQVFWDRSATMRRGFWGGLWAMRKFLVALVLAGGLTWREWAEHHPPEIVIVALLHFIFVFALIAVLVLAGQRFRHRNLPTR